jgi:hypothetical protein
LRKIFDGTLMTPRLQKRSSMEALFIQSSLKSIEIVKPLAAVSAALSK